MKTSEIRQAFLDFFIQKHHQLVPSSPIIPANDATLLFTNAGMVPFKDTFLGLETRAYHRAVSSQLCLRAGGKHNDLENVGYTARHHTLFEMLGNFSFGDYFKREAIAWAWEFLTQVLQLPEERLWVTVYHEDQEAEAIWLQEMKVSAERFSRCGEKDNFWSMGDTGPCGPCSEIFYDHGPEIAGGPPGSPEEDGDRYVEIWNLVFMQFNRDKQGQLQPLPKPSVDTGMGLERIAAVLQQRHNNYDIDVFASLMDSIVALKPGLDRQQSSLKVIADHIRACCFLIAEGVIPGNEGRSYVLRRIIRRAVRHAHKLGISSPFLHRLVKPLGQLMGEQYPQLREQQALIEQQLQQEENQFSRTLEQGLSLLKAAIADLKQPLIPGALAFRLYDTYGFPLDLTEDIAREQGLVVDKDGFDQAMQQQRSQSQSASQFHFDYHSLPRLDIASDFQGYAHHRVNTIVTAVLKEGKECTTLQAGEEAVLVLAASPFYAESGGQIGDSGVLRARNGVFRVHDTQKSGAAILHIGTLEQGNIGLNDAVEAIIDEARREAIRLNHTATHLLHAALQKLIDPQIMQKGSLVNDKRTRFDFSHPQALRPEQIQALESMVNAVIRKNYPVVTEEMPIEEAKKSGAVALFGEKYAETVRVLTIADYSKELCGGTHVRQTGDIGVFKIIAEYGIASGIRRIEMVTGDYALQYLNEQLDILNKTATLLRTSPDKIEEKSEQILQDLKKLEKEQYRLQQKLAAKSGAELRDAFVQLSGGKLLVKELEGVDNQALRQTLDQLKAAVQDAVIVLYKISDQKINVIAGVSPSLLGQAPSAADLVKQICGKGGGREDMAQGGGALPDDLPRRLTQLEAMVRQHLN
ncbi:MAG: alanine--tRNA ligase [Legionellaceae bacterium]|nr:alanine--tRNA ligase [Legionellaceae bacterium]